MKIVDLSIGSVYIKDGKRYVIVGLKNNEDYSSISYDRIYYVIGENELIKLKGFSKEEIIKKCYSIKVNSNEEMYLVEKVEDAIYKFDNTVTFNKM